MGSYLLQQGHTSPISHSTTNCGPNIQMSGTMGDIYCLKESQSHWLLPCSLWSLSLCLISTMNREDQAPLISALCTRMKESTTLKGKAALTCWQHWVVPRERKMRDWFYMVLFPYAIPEALPGETGITSWSFKRIFNFFFLWRIKQWRRELW